MSIRKGNVIISGKGSAGEDGYSPTASVSKVGDTATISITDKNGTTTAIVSDGQDGQTIQYSTMPTASVDYVGQIVQYTGTTDSTYTNGYFYVCTTDGEEPATYSWENIQVQVGNSSGKNYDFATNYSVRVIGNTYNTSSTGANKQVFDLASEMYKDIIENKAVMSRISGSVGNDLNGMYSTNINLGLDYYSLNGNNATLWYSQQGASYGSERGEFSWSTATMNGDGENLTSIVFSGLNEYRILSVNNPKAFFPDINTYEPATGKFVQSVLQPINDILKELQNPIGNSIYYYLDSNSMILTHQPPESNRNLSLSQLWGQTDHAWKLIYTYDARQTIKKTTRFKIQIPYYSSWDKEVPDVVSFNLVWKRGNNVLYSTNDIPYVIKYARNTINTYEISGIDLDVEIGDTFEIDIKANKYYGFSSDTNIRSYVANPVMVEQIDEVILSDYVYDEINNEMISQHEINTQILPTITTSSTSTYTIASLTGNQTYKLGEIEDLTITAVTTFDRESIIYFDSGTTPTDISIPDSLTNLGDVPTLTTSGGVSTGTCTASKSYIIAILNNIAVWKEY